MKHRIWLGIFFVFSCKKAEKPLQSGTITFYHEIENEIVSEVYIPSGFTPGNNGINDFFFPQWRGSNGKNYRMEIFNGYHQRLYTTFISYRGWDGTDGGRLMPAGEYKYCVTVTDTTGFVYNINGNFALLR